MGKLGEQRRLSERSETEQVQPRPDFFRAQQRTPEGLVHWGALFWVLYLTRDILVPRPSGARKSASISSILTKCRASKKNKSL